MKLPSALSALLALPTGLPEITPLSMEPPRHQRRRQPVRQIVQYLARRYFWGAQVARSAWIDPTASIDRTHPAGIEIADRAWIGPYAVVLAHDMSRGVYADTRIGVGSIVGARAVIMPGVKVGDGAVVHPGAVVSRDVAAGQEVAGNPARPLPTRSSAIPPG